MRFRLRAASLDPPSGARRGGRLGEARLPPRRRSAGKVASSGALLSAALLLSASASATGGSFNPQGRARKAAPARTAPPRPTPARAARPERPDQLIARYLGILERQPGAEFPLQRLVQLFRQRDGKLDALIEIFEQRAQDQGDRARAARLSLAGVLVHAGRREEALELYRQLGEQRPADAAVKTRLARVLATAGKLEEAREQLLLALPLRLEKSEREEALRTLVDWSLELRDLPMAKELHDKRVALTGGSFFVRAELGRKLMERGQHAEAAEQFRRLLPFAQGDARTLAPTLRDLGKALLAQGKHEEALDVLTRAERASGGQLGLRREIFEALVTAHRALQRLPELIDRLERGNRGSFDDQVLLGGLYAELGRVGDALRTYESALRKRPRAIEPRLAAIQLYQLQGDLAKALEHRKVLAALAPDNSDFAFRLAEAYLQAGKRKRGLGVLEKLRHSPHSETRLALVAFYEKIGEANKALSLLEELAKSGSVHHLTELGSRYFRKGEVNQALAVWKRIEKPGPGHADSLHALGEVYLEHDMAERALDALRRARELAPNSPRFARSLAVALERAASSQTEPDARDKYHREAQSLWEELLQRATRVGDGREAREARQHMVMLWGLGRTLSQRESDLQKRFASLPPDLEAGRLLSEAQFRLRKFAAAEQTLGRLLELAPGDVQSRLRLERALVQQGKLQAAIATVEELAKVDPPRAKEYYQRMARYAAQLYEDERALAYARRAVELGPEDAKAHVHLGKMHLANQQSDEAIAEYRQALRHDDRLFSVYFDLAELLLSRGEVDEADRLFRKVVRSSPDEHLIARAARASLQLHLGRGSVETLEAELLPLALGHSERPIYRRLLVEVYGALAFPLVQQGRSGDAEAAAEAEHALEAIGRRAVKPLLDTLADSREDQQRIALQLLAHLGNKNAGPALLSFATSAASPTLRLQAMLAIANLRDPALRSRLEEYLFRQGAGEADPTHVAAAWALAGLPTTRSRPALLRLLEERSPTLQTLAILGLGAQPRRSDRQLLRGIAESPRHSPLPRAAAALALSAQGPSGALPTIGSLLESSDSVVVAAAIAALTQLDAPGAQQALARALITGDADLVQAAARIACGAQRAGRGANAWRWEGHSIVDGRVDARRLLSTQLPGPCAPEEEARALARLGPALAGAVLEAARSSAEEARDLAQRLSDDQGRPALPPLSTRLALAPEASQRSARSAVAGIAEALLAPMMQLASHPDARLRQSALSWLVWRPEPQARSAVLAALSDRDTSVQRTALSLLQHHPLEGAAGSITRLLTNSRAWPVRLEAIKALQHQPRPTEVERQTLAAALSLAALEDAYALVRHAAAEALLSVAPRAARPVLETVARQDAEPEVREAVRQLLER